MDEHEDELPFFKRKKVKWVMVIIAIVAVMSLLVLGARAQRAEEAAEQKAAEELQANQEEESAPDSINGGTDQMLYRLQEDLEYEYGPAPDGFIWDQQGNPISLGIASMSSEDAVYAYLRSLSTLDMGMAQKLSRGSTVVERYSDYFTSTRQDNTDYSDDLSKDIYKVSLLSIQNNGVADSSVFAENKRVYTVKATMIDLTDKEFWREDETTLFENIYKADQGQSDSTKAELYVNEYIMSHYNSGNAKTRDVTFNITVEKYPDLNSGWLVSIDSELDDLLGYTDGTPVNENIMTEYRHYKQDRITEGN